MASPPSSRRRTEQLLDFLREALEPTIGAYNSLPTDETGKGGEPSVVGQALLSQLAQVRDLAILRSGLGGSQPIPVRETAKPREVEPAFITMFRGAMAHEVLNSCLSRGGTPEDPDFAWELYRAALLLALQSPLFPDVTKDEHEAAVRRLAARYVRDRHLAPSKLPADAQGGLQELQRTFDIDRSAGEWVALTVGIDRVLTHWHKPRRIRLDRPGEYWHGKVSELPLLGLDEVGLVEERYHRDEELHKPVPGLTVFLQDFRRRVIAGARSWLEEYRRNPEESLNSAAPETSDRDPNARPQRDRFARLLKPPHALKKEEQQLRLLLTVADDRLPDSKQHQAAGHLVEQLFRRPVHPRRWQVVSERFDNWREATEAARVAAVESLLEGVWQAGQQRVWDYYSELLSCLRGYLDREVTERLAGPGWHRQRHTWHKGDQDEGEWKKGEPKEEFLPDVAARQVSHDAANLEAAASVYRDSVREEWAQERARFNGWREELAVFFRGAGKQNRALWTVMRQVAEDTGRVNVSEGYRRFESWYPDLPASSSEDTFRRRWRELLERLRDHLLAA